MANIKNAIVSLSPDGIVRFNYFEPVFQAGEMPAIDGTNNVAYSQHAVADDGSNNQLVIECISLVDNLEYVGLPETSPFFPPAVVQIPAFDYPIENTRRLQLTKDRQYLFLVAYTSPTCYQDIQSAIPTGSKVIKVSTITGEIVAESPEFTNTYSISDLVLSADDSMAYVTQDASVIGLFTSDLRVYMEATVAELGNDQVQLLDVCDDGTQLLVSGTSGVQVVDTNSFAVSTMSPTTPADFGQILGAIWAQGSNTNYIASGLSSVDGITLIFFQEDTSNNLITTFTNPLPVTVGQIIDVQINRSNGYAYLLFVADATIGDCTVVCYDLVNQIVLSQVHLQGVTLSNVALDRGGA